MRLTISAKIVIGFAAITCLMIALAVLTHLGIQAIVKTYDDHVLRLAESVRLVERAQKAVALEEAALSIYLATGDREQLERFQQAGEIMTATLAELGDLANPGRAEELLARLRQDHLAYAQAALASLSAAGRASPAAANGVSASAPGITTQLETSYKTLAAVLNEFREHQIEAQGAARSQAYAVRQRLTRRTWFLGILTVLTGIAFAAGTSRVIARPVRYVAQAAQRLAEGDLTIEQLIVKSRDELRDMASSFNQMVANLRHLVTEMTQASDELAGKSAEITSTAQGTAEATQQIYQLIQQVAVGAAEQNGAVQETATVVSEQQQAIDQVANAAQSHAEAIRGTIRVMQELSTGVASVVGSVQAMTASSRESVVAAHEGEEAVRETADGIDEIRAAVLSTAQKIQELGESSRQIGAIVEVIAGIADQTNLLALNAAIEAARAGEHGRGFAVVADEVRSLAENSARSAKEIAGLISKIQAGIDDAIQAMTAGIERVERGTARAKRAGESLQRILETFEELQDRIVSISQDASRMRDGIERVERSMGKVSEIVEANTAALEEMAAQSEQVTRAVSRIAAVSQETAAASEQVRAAASETASSSERMRDSAQALAAMALRFKSIVARFKLQHS